MNDLLDMFFEKDGHEPDWAAIRTYIYLLDRPRSTLLDVLQTMWAVYESDDVAAQKTLIFRLQEGL